MAEVQITNCPRGKSFQGMNLIKDVTRKNRILRIEAPLGIIGIPGSGRKTLAYRFCHMDRGAFQDEVVPVASCYIADFEGSFSKKSTDNPFGQFKLKLSIYIIEPPAEIEHPAPPLYWLHWNNFCCLIFAFDIRNQTSFREASLKLRNYRLRNYLLPVCILAGNKSDRRNEPSAQAVNLENPEYLNQREVPMHTAYTEAEQLGAYYYECSAKYNTGVSGLLSLVKRCACERRYWIADML